MTLGRNVVEPPNEGVESDAGKHMRRYAVSPVARAAHAGR